MPPSIFPKTSSLLAAPKVRKVDAVLKMPLERITKLPAILAIGLLSADKPKAVASASFPISFTLKPLTEAENFVNPSAPLTAFPEESTSCKLAAFNSSAKLLAFAAPLVRLRPAKSPTTLAATTPGREAFSESNSGESFLWSVSAIPVARDPARAPKSPLPPVLLLSKRSITLMACWLNLVNIMPAAATEVPKILTESGI